MQTKKIRKAVKKNYTVRLTLEQKAVGRFNRALKARRNGDIFGMFLTKEKAISKSPEKSFR